MATPKSIAFHTLGCKLNYAETSTLAQLFRDRGYHIAPADEPADIFVLNTCSVTDFADRKCRKAVRQAQRVNPDVRVIVTGCYAQLQPEEIAGIPGVDLVLGAGHKFRIVDYVEALERSAERAWIQAGAITDVSDFEHAHSYGDRTRSFLKIQDGCDYKCSFCTIPRARGASRSPRIDEIIEQANRLNEQGVMEVVLTGVNIGDFGAHHEGTRETFLDLIRALELQTKIPRYRISSIEPNLCHDEVIAFVSGSSRFMPHFHMPLQSGCNRTLRSMKRRYKRELYAQRVSTIREQIPHACIGVDVIVGFPGETEEDFLDSVAFIRSLDISYLHVFTYSERPGTPAAEMQDSVPMQIRRTRNAILHRVSEEKRRSFYQEHLGQTREVLLEGSETADVLEGFTDNYIKVQVKDQALEPNSIIPVSMDQYVARDVMVLGEPVPCLDHAAGIE